MAELTPSIIAADFRSLSRQLGLVEPFSVRWHVDVMDGHYVPNLTIGPMVVEAIKNASQLPQDVHLMITNPDETWEWYAKAGAARIAFHPSESPDTPKLLRTLREAGIGPGIAVNPDVSADDVKPLLDAVEFVIVMSVYPGFSGQRFISDVLPKVSQLREWLGDDVDLVMDGGVNVKNARQCVDAGANLLVSASAIFSAADPAAVAKELHELGAG